MPRTHPRNSGLGCSRSSGADGAIMIFCAAPLPETGTGCQVRREPLGGGPVRLFIVGCLLLLSSGAAAQSRWILSVGPEWTPYYGANQFIGGRVRGEYDL